jgi:diguanylate cyclase (GGDEF)-like protein
MEAEPDSADPRAHDAWSRAEGLYAVTLFVLAAVALVLAFALPGRAVPDQGLGTWLFFLLYGLFTISVGYRHPTFGYYSFDRVAQVASILVLGPVEAACINGLASLIYPWHRLFRGAPWRSVVCSALNNAGLMALIILLSGSLYAALGGAVPLLDMTGGSIAKLVLLVLSMQFLNDLGMLGLLWLGRRSLEGFFSKFSYALELGSGAAAVLVAVVYNSMELAVFVLLLGVLSLGMLALRQFANMRYQLELIVDERTKSLREKTHELELQAMRDNLTGLYNRRYADRYLQEQLQLSGQLRLDLTIALADIDLFKQINDMHSHATGDEVLRRVATILRERCRSSDMIARYGGEEFLLCFPSTNLARAQILCEELRAAIEHCNWTQMGLAGGVTISFGIAERRGDVSPDTLLNRADLHLYAAKNNGRNIVVA